MKKTIATLLAGAMALSLVPMASALTLNDFAANQEFNIAVPANIMVKQSSGEYEEGITITQNTNDFPVSFDYKTTLYMEPVREAFKDYIKLAEGIIAKEGGADKATLLAELEECLIEGRFIVDVINEDGMSIPDAMKNGTNMYGFNEEAKKAFRETVPRVYNEQTGILTITIMPDTSENGDYILKKELAPGGSENSANWNLDEYFPDLTLTCEGVSVADFGTYDIGGKVYGDTWIKDSAGHNLVWINYNATQGIGSVTGNNTDPVEDATVIIRQRSSGGGLGGGNVASGTTKPESFTVNVEVDGNSLDKQTATSAITYNPYDLDIPKKDHNLFAGWYNKATDTVIEGAAEYDKNTTIEARWIATDDINIGFVVDGKEADANSKKTRGVNVTQDDIIVGEDGVTVNVKDIDIVVPQGMKFDGWFTDAACTIPAAASIVLTQDTVLYGKTSKIGSPDVLDTDHHYAYIIGYPDGTVKPQKNISREEVATIFFRLLTEEARAEYLKKTNDFTDVPAEKWSNAAISTMSNYGLVNGYEDGTFKPTANITRAEFVTMAARFYDVDDTATATFTDCSGHWAEKYIASAVANGWVQGYEGNLFKPDQSITRAEAMAIVNNMLQRQVNAEGLAEDAVEWTDNTADAWYYYDVLEATNSHKCEDRAENVLDEVWTECIENFDWSTLEK